METMELRQQQAKHWLVVVKPRITQALEARYDAYLRKLVANPNIGPAERERLAERKEDRLLDLLRAVMRGTAHAYVEGGQQHANDFLDLALPIVAEERRL